MSSSQDGTTSPKSLFGWYKEHITGAIASFAALATMAGCVVLKERSGWTTDHGNQKSVFSPARVV